ncbi:MAG: hypothetical protein E7068_09705 [Lentimicrobiaceae bacterium]|nr:hypothetical protein [Lentimicrobiaceae bacterium]
MAFNDDNFLDDYEIQELIKKFEDQLESGMTMFFDADELNIIMEHYVQQNDIEKINIIADLASTYHNTNPLTNLIMAKKYLSVQDTSNAMTYLNEEDNNTEDPDYQLSLAYCYSLMEEHKKSLSAYKRAIKLLENDNCDDIYNSMAVEYMLLHDYEHALYYFKKGIKACPDISEQYIEITNCYFFLERSDEAIEFFKGEVDKNPYSIAAWMSLGNCYLRLHLLEKAVEQYEYALAINQHYEIAYVNIATIYNELDKYKDSIEIIEEAFRNKVEKPILYCLYGEALAKTGNKLDAITNFKKAIELDENIAEAYAGLGFIFCEENNHKSAIKFLKHANQLAPYNTDYLFVLVEQHNKLEKFKTSLKYLKEIEDIFPYDVNLYIAYMEVYILMDDVRNAVKSLEKGMKMLGRQASLLYRLAFINFVDDDHESGMMNLEEALSLDYEGVQEFIDFDPNYLLNNESIVNLINEYKNKNNK